MNVNATEECEENMELRWRKGYGLSRVTNALSALYLDEIRTNVIIIEEET